MSCALGSSQFVLPIPVFLYIMFLDSVPLHANTMEPENKLFSEIESYSDSDDIKKGVVCCLCKAQEGQQFPAAGAI